ncbi:hypothetical protein [Curtobacterium sp. MCPF17_031]|uniref:hypothetical protein n=1 Tax=Curtobacterium sp. MCPF17_031 TaxID=2175653 RepID=UPI0011B5D7BD|nr:hypothetical protein [Curtobacterium sp. MCPF17_031]
MDAEMLRLLRMDTETLQRMSLQDAEARLSSYLHREELPALEEVFPTAPVSELAYARDRVRSLHVAALAWANAYLDSPRSSTETVERIDARVDQAWRESWSDFSRRSVSAVISFQLMMNR